MDKVFHVDNLIKILNVINDGIYIADKDGTTLWYNKASAQICKQDMTSMIGKSVWDLEKEGVFNPSVCRLTIESKKVTTTVQEMRDGRKYLVTGYPIYNDQGDFELVVAHSRDITEAAKTAVQLEEAEILLRKYSQEIRLMQLAHQDNSMNRLVGISPGFKSLITLIERVSNTDTTILLLGETGVGKNVIAEKIHQLSERNKQQFVQINCGALPESLIESELFGYRRGAFSGASASGKIGLVELADKGTLFLDEIGELPLHLQTKLLHLLQNKTFTPIGDVTPKKVDIRIIAATNRDLAEMVKEKKFREDLYYRLNIVPIRIPPLRERKEDIFPLLHYYLQKFNRKHRENKKFAQSTLDILMDYSWPGNIRELENLVERLVLTAQNEQIEPTDLPANIHQQNSFYIDSHFNKDEPLKNIIERIEKEIIQHTYNKYKTTRKAAEVLDISQTSFVRKMKKYQIKARHDKTE